MRRKLIRGCVAGVFAVAAAIAAAPAGQVTATEPVDPGLGGKVNTIVSPNSLPGSDYKIPCTPGGLC